MNWATWMTGIDKFHQEITSKGYKCNNPGLDETLYDAKCAEVNILDLYPNTPNGGGYPTRPAMPVKAPGTNSLNTARVMANSPAVLESFLAFSQAMGCANCSPVACLPMLGAFPTGLSERRT